jgi:hypothetical protein
MQNNNDHMGGYVKYFTDLPAMFGYPVTVTFPKDDRMSVISQGAIGAVVQLPPEGDGLRRGVKHSMTTSSFASAPYSLVYDAEHAERALEPYAGGTIGLVGLGTLPVSLVDYLRGGKLSKAKFVDASDLVDRIKVIKSAEEIALVRRTPLQDVATMPLSRRLPQHASMKLLLSLSMRYGGGNRAFICVPLSGLRSTGQAAWQGNRHLQNRARKATFTLLVETNGPGDIELGRSCVSAGAPSGDMPRLS